jgi:hypothetical protein
MHGLHGLAGEPQCVHLATRVAGTGRGLAATGGEAGGDGDDSDGNDAASAWSVAFLDASF